MRAHQAQGYLLHARAAEAKGRELVDRVEVRPQATCHALHAVRWPQHECVASEELRRVVAQTELLGVATEDHYRHGVVESLVDPAGIHPVRRDEKVSGLQQRAGPQLSRELAPLERIERGIAVGEQARSEDAAEASGR